jgi:hypothetical protein
LIDGLRDRIGSNDPGPDRQVEHDRRAAAQGSTG